MKRFAVLALPVLLAACTLTEGNNAENGAALGGEDAGEAPIMGGDGGTPPGSPPNSGNPAPPTSEDPQGDVSLTASPATTEAGATVTLSLNNSSKEAIGYNLCTSTIENAAGANVRTDRVCTMELRTLQAGQKISYGYALPSSLADGRYRFVAGLETMGTGGRFTVRSNWVEVQ